MKMNPLPLHMNLIIMSYIEPKQVANVICNHGLWALNTTGYDEEVMYRIREYGYLITYALYNGYITKSEAKDFFRYGNLGNATPIVINIKIP
jgi:hypothetical protein